MARRELATQQKKVQATEAALADYRDKQNALSLDDKQNIVLSRLNKLNDDVVGAKTRKAQKEVLYSQIKGLTPAELGKASAIAQNVAGRGGPGPRAGNAGRARAPGAALR